jgi:hypothetical protein
MPLSDSDSMAKIGLRAAPSNRFNSRVLVMKVRRTEIKYQIRNGNMTRMYGRTTIVVIIAPTTMNAIIRKSKSVGGN